MNLDNFKSFLGKPFYEDKDVLIYHGDSFKWINQVYRCTSSHGAFWVNLGYFSLPQKGHIWQKS